MNRPSHAEMTLLALLRDGPAHAYELVQKVQAMRVDQWARVRESTLYNVLRRMEKQGWVVGLEEAGERGRARVAYERTAEGEAHLLSLVESRLHDPEPIYSDVLVAGIIAADMGSAEVLDRGLTRLEARRERLEVVRSETDLSGYGRTVLDFYIGLVGLEIDALRSLKARGSNALMG